MLLYSGLMTDASQFDPRAPDADLVMVISGAPPGEARDAEDELYRRLAPRVRLYGLRHLKNEQAAADLTQHVLMMTIEKLRLGKLREPEKLASFVLGTCRMVVLDWRRGVVRQERLLEQYTKEQPVFEEFSTPEIDSRQLTDCLQRLLERERSVLVMTYYAERTTGSVAEQLGLTLENVRVIRHRALGRLRRCMSQGGSSS
jgi:RNA polymerase sigma-70 factor (ECF subfamily)